MKKIEFKLTMPGKASWNGRWSGEGSNYTIIKKLSDKKVIELLPGDKAASWHYRWNDGWCACVTARIVKPKEKLIKSNGFCGYDWMVNNILLYGTIKEPGEK